jgi:hypothetical protein
VNVALAFVGVLAAFACALADSAGLRGAIDAGQALPRADEEARHRALLFGRVVGHLCAGVGAARALGGAIDRPWALGSPWRRVRSSRSRSARRPRESSATR